MHRAASIGVVAIAVAAFAAPAAGQTSSDARQVIVAQGEATIRHAPDVAWVEIGVEARGGRPDDAREEAARAMNAVMNTLKKIVPSQAVQTSGYSVVPEMEYADNGSRLKDYLARNRIDVRVDDLDKLARVLDSGIGSGATSVSGVRFDVKDRDKYEREALEQAVRDAMERARAMADGAGQRLGSIVRIQEQRSSPPGPRMMSAVGGRGFSEQTPVPISPGEIEITAAVTATIAIR